MAKQENQDAKQENQDTYKVLLAIFFNGKNYNAGDTIQASEQELGSLISRVQKV